MVGVVERAFRWLGSGRRVIRHLRFLGASAPDDPLDNGRVTSAVARAAEAALGCSPRPHRVPGDFGGSPGRPGADGTSSAE
jgi:hypothetical protein